MRVRGNFPIKQLVLGVNTLYRLSQSRQRRIYHIFMSKLLENVLPVRSADISQSSLRSGAEVIMEDVSNSWGPLGLGPTL